MGASTSTPTTCRFITRALYIAAAPERVYRAFTEREELERWFVTDADIELRPGGAYNLNWGPGQRVAGMVVDIDAPRRFVWDEDWVGGPGVTRVSVELAPVEHGVQLRLRHEGFGDGPAWDEQFASVERGWAAELEHLRVYLEHGRVKRWPPEGEAQ
jgi:uncharacterized protein YndB with AHSA1/START domain